MALRNQPYIPLYVQDFLTDEKLIECSAEATGVYIRLICVLHKSEEYGKILLKQKDKQSTKHLLNFASKLLKQMPYPIEVIERSLQELLIEGVITIDDDVLYQKRMVRDNDISIKRSECGQKGGKKTQFASKFAKAKVKANSENEYEIEIDNKNKGNRSLKKPSIEEIKSYCLERKNKVNPETFLNYYESNGWKVGKNPMKDWKAAVRTWEKNNFSTGVNNGTHIKFATERDKNNQRGCDELDRLLAEKTPVCDT
jgi:hypothetical protein